MIFDGLFEYGAVRCIFSSKSTSRCDDMIGDNVRLATVSLQTIREDRILKYIHIRHSSDIIQEVLFGEDHVIEVEDWFSLRADLVGVPRGKSQKWMLIIKAMMKSTPSCTVLYSCIDRLIPALRQEARTMMEEDGLAFCLRDPEREALSSIGVGEYGDSCSVSFQSCTSLIATIIVYGDDLVAAWGPAYTLEQVCEIAITDFVIGWEDDRDHWWRFRQIGQKSLGACTMLIDRVVQTKVFLVWIELMIWVAHHVWVWSHRELSGLLAMIYRGIVFVQMLLDFMIHHLSIYTMLPLDNLNFMIFVSFDEFLILS